MITSGARRTTGAWAPAVLLLAAGACSTKDSTGPVNTYVGGWEGLTSQNYPLRFYVTEQGLPLVAVEYRLVGSLCTDHSSVWLSREPPDTAYALAGGAFTAAISGTPGTITVTGSFASAVQASGTMAVNSLRCGGTLDLTWTAAKATGAAADLTGTWTGTYATSLVPTASITLTITQSGSALGGTYLSSNGAAGTVSGTVSGKVGTFNLTQTTSGCAGSFAGHAALHEGPDLLFLAWAGSDCLGTHAKAGGMVTRP